MRKKSSPKPAPLFSAAIQDHLIRKIGLSTAKKQKPKWRPGEQAKAQTVETAKMLEEDYCRKKQALIDQQQQIKFKNYKSNLTLAERLGIFKPPPGPMQPVEWAKVELKSKARQDSRGDCVICLQPFRDKQQVILSCSHVFHKSCLRSFERFNRMRTCPICRVQNYEQKQTVQGIKQYALYSLTKIQSQIRMHLLNQNFFESLLKEGYVAKSEAFSRRVILYKMSRLSLKLRRRTDEQQKRIRIMITSMREAQQKDAQLLFGELLDIYHKRKLDQAVLPSHLKDLDWDLAFKKALQRNQPCAICLADLKGRVCSLLSCSHLLHKQCLSSYQQFSLEQGCPYCRKAYEKRQVKVS